MDKGLGNESASISSSSSSYSNSNSNSNSNRDMMYLKQINKSSHKISKPVIRKPILPPHPLIVDPNPLPQPQPQPQSQQPPVYNINKNDFRDVVQKLTGSPAHDRFPTPPPPPQPPVTHPRPPSSRLQRIRPPPLSQITNRPPPQLLPAQPFPPLPPLPSVHPAAESPISAYMRFLQSSGSSPAPSPLWNGVAPIGPRPDSLPPPNDGGQRAPTESPVSAYMRFLQSSVHSSSAASPRWNGVAQPLAPPQQQQPLPSSAFPLSPLPFGCIPSPRSTYGMLSPSFLLSPTGQLGLPQLPLSPTLPVPSPRWKGM